MKEDSIKLVTRIFTPNGSGDARKKFKGRKEGIA